LYRVGGADAGVQGYDSAADGGTAGKPLLAESLHEPAVVEFVTAIALCHEVPRALSRACVCV
jgi:hypothetical protein